ncbi:carboxyvinyl-carboxyphosphonate phosphorylmutase [Synechococcus moorigangaii CMS01]|nr:carboxyvinyl-carboxyphosphonate phosphorylmutase [Synechococcus moorigangaii CMS01]
MSLILKDRLASGPALLAPGVYDALSALLAEQAGFEAAYLSGASVAYTQLGRPDIGLVSLDHLADVTRRITERVSLPLIVDADTGFGNALNVQRTVRMLERAGASAIQVEDQTFPKRCGHLRGKGVIPAAEMASKIRAATDARQSANTLIIARTDAIAVEGFDAAMDRAEAFLEAGADVLFIEAPRDLDQMRQAAKRFAARAPLLANMVEGGDTPLSNVEALSELGYRLVISPGALVRALIPAAEAFFATLKADGSTGAFRDRMTDLAGVNARIGLDDMLATGQRYEAPPAGDNQA